MKEAMILVLLAMFVSSCSGSDEIAGVTRSEQPVNSPDLERIVQRALVRRGRGEVHSNSYPMGDKWVDFTMTKAQLAPNTNAPPERVIPVGILMAETRKEVERLFPETSGWQFEGVDLKRLTSAADRFKNQQRFGTESSPSGAWSLSWVYFVSWSRFTKEEAQTLSVPVLLSGEVIRGEISKR